MPSSMLQQSTHQLDELLQASPAVIYATDAAWWRGRLHYICLEIETLTGLDREALYARPESWLELLTPGSRQSALTRLARAIDDNSDRLSLDYTLQKGDGALRHFQDDIVIHRNQHGEIVELVGSLTDVTKRQSLLERFEDLSDQLPGTLYQCRLTPDGQLSFPLVSAGVQRLFGMSPTRIVEDPQEAIGRVHPDDADTLWRNIHRSATRLNVWRCEFRYRHPRGHQLWVSGHATPQREEDGSILWHGFCEDITLRKQAQLALTESERRYRFIIEHVSDLIMLFDDEGACRFASPSVQEVLGYVPDDLYGRSLIELLPPDDAPRVQRRLHEASRQGKNLQLELRARHCHGHYIWLEISCSPYISPLTNRYEWILGVMRDVTTRKLREMKLHEMSTTDSLTGALNRGAFLECVKTEIDASDAMPSRLSLVIFDIDNFKKINDTWGHAAGDLVLASLGDICRSTLRAHDIFGRIGGEEFALVLGGQSLNEAAKLAERLRQKFENVRVEFYGQWLNFTVSFGIAERQEQESLEALMHRADMGLYAAKHQGRNRVNQALCKDT
ncbi:sensor domain-containing diguanylate cyclase [Modicisalibacter ilicicola]|nr:sensor domain-containing diguanylate cyclase [Halomonas ilicicola]